MQFREGIMHNKLKIIIHYLFILMLCLVCSCSSNFFDEPPVQPFSTPPQPVVIIEEFSANTCSPCAYAATHFHDLLQNYPSKNVVLIRYPVSWPNPGDWYWSKLSSEHQSSILTRKSYYNTFGIPATFINGSSKYYSYINSDLINAHLSTSPSFNITIHATSSNKFEITILPLKNYQSGNYLLRTQIIETKYIFETAPGNNGQTIFDGTTLVLFDDQTITPINHREQTFSFTFQVNDISIHPETKKAIVCYIQRYDTREILHACYLEL
jgi:thiol-disulfide isomerase/thioredoxin